MGIFDRIDKFATELGELVAPDDVRAHIELGAAFLERGDFDAATHELERAVAAKPDHLRAHYLLGLAQFRRGDLRLAEESFKTAAKQAAKDGMPEAEVALGELYLQKHDLEGAIVSYRRALGLGISGDAARGEVYRGLGAAYLRQQDIDKAIRELRKAAASLPDDIETQTLLGRAFFFDGKLDAARICLERADTKGHAPRAALLTLAQVHEQLTHSEAAERAFERVLAPAERDEIAVDARLGLARLAMAKSDFAAAQTHLSQALQVSPTRSDLMFAYGRMLAATASPQSALDAFDRALKPGGDSHERSLFDPKPILEAGLSLALRHGLIEAANRYASDLLARIPDHPDALAARARALLPTDLEGASKRATQALEQKETVETRLAIAAVYVARADFPSALASLRRAAELAQKGDARPSDAIAALHRTEQQAGKPTSLYEQLQFAHRLFSRNTEFAELSAEAGRVSESLDRPLSVVVMGEFNAGKSTFVNALLGEEVAAMGITPTTAAIAILKYGSERKGRVHYLDNRTRELSWAEIGAFLSGLSSDEASRIGTVELLYPLETLQRVNIVDTPGLNSIHPEHEQVARRFIAEADAVVWLFSVDQAAKASEGRALTTIRESGKKILGVLNKIDRISDEERAEVTRHIERSLGSALETLLPFSARRALQARKSGDGAELIASHYSALEAALEERFFSRAKSILHDAAKLRLLQLLDRGDDLARKHLSARSFDAIATAEDALAKAKDDFIRRALPTELAELQRSLDEVLSVCADEVLEFVRPRRWALGANQASIADRDFLVGLFQDQIGAALDGSATRLAAELERLGIARAKARLHAEVYDRFLAFARGMLAGGRVDDLFARVLPKIELSQVEIKRALSHAAPLSQAIREQELQQPLRSFVEDRFAKLESDLRAQRSVIEIKRVEIEARLCAPIDWLRQALQA